MQIRKQFVWNDRICFLIKTKHAKGYSTEFQNAGLTVITNANMDTGTRETATCDGKRRKKRSIGIVILFVTTSL